MSIYTPEMASAVRKMKKPFPFTLDFAELDAQLNLLVYESEYRKLSTADQLNMMQHVHEVALMLETFGVPVNIQGVPGEPRRL